MKRKRAIRKDPQDKVRAEELAYNKTIISLQATLQDWRNMVYSRDRSVQHHGMTAQYRIANRFGSFLACKEGEHLTMYHGEGWLQYQEELIEPLVGDPYHRLTVLVVPRTQGPVEKQKKEKQAPKTVNVDDLKTCLEKKPQCHETFARFAAKERLPDPDNSLDTTVPVIELLPDGLPEMPALEEVSQDDLDFLVAAEKMINKKKEEEVAPTPVVEDYEKWRQNKMRAELKLRKLSQRGTNPELRARLMADDLERLKPKPPKSPKKKNRLRKRDFEASSEAEEASTDHESAEEEEEIFSN